MVRPDLMRQNMNEMFESSDCLMVSDGTRTFFDFYREEAIFLAIICNTHEEDCMKTRKMPDGKDVPGGDFIVAIRTKYGFSLFRVANSFWNNFKIPEAPLCPDDDGTGFDINMERIVRTFLGEKFLPFDEDTLHNGITRNSNMFEGDFE